MHEFELCVYNVSQMSDMHICVKDHCWVENWTILNFLVNIIVFIFLLIKWFRCRMSRHLRMSKAVMMLNKSLRRWWSTSKTQQNLPDLGGSCLRFVMIFQHLKKCASNGPHAYNLFKVSAVAIQTLEQIYRNLIFSPLLLVFVMDLFLAHLQ